MGRPKNTVLLDGEKVRLLRENLDLTQEAFVALDVVEMSLSALRRIESGAAASREHAYQISQALSAPLESLFIIPKDYSIDTYTLLSNRRSSVFYGDFHPVYVARTDYEPEVDFRLCNGKLSIRGPVSSIDPENFFDRHIQWLDTFTQRMKFSFEFVFEVTEIWSDSKFLLRELVCLLVENSKLLVTIRWKYPRDRSKLCNLEIYDLGVFIETYLTRRYGNCFLFIMEKSK